MKFMFIDDNNVVNRDGLRTYVFQQLTTMKQIARQACIDERDFWDKAETAAKKTLFGKELDTTIATIQQINHLPFYIQLWIDTAVDTAERFDFFVVTKAHEIQSGDQQHDYFWAMQIRHDQLMGLVRVLQVLLDKIKQWISENPQKLLDDEVFLGLTEADIEKQVYREAEKIYKERQALAGNS